MTHSAINRPPVDLEPLSRFQQRFRLCVDDLPFSRRSDIEQKVAALGGLHGSENGRCSGIGLRTRYIDEGVYDVHCTAVAIGLGSGVVAEASRRSAINGLQHL
jgi:hypothetical protein